MSWRIQFASKCARRAEYWLGRGDLRRAEGFKAMALEQLRKLDVEDYEQARRDGRVTTVRPHAQEDNFPTEARP